MSLELAAKELHYDPVMLESYNRVGAAVQQIIASEPIQIKVDTGTDLGVLLLGLGGIISSIVIAFFTYKVQRNQIKASVSNLRHHWRNELRDCTAEFLQVLTTLMRSSLNDPNFINADQRYDLYDKAHRLQIKMSLLLSGDDPLTKRINALATEALRNANKLQYRGDCSLVVNNLTDFEILMQKQLEVSWTHIQVDLGLRKLKDRKLEG